MKNLNLKDLQKSAEQGFMYAQHDMGTMCIRGLGVPKDYKKALHWYEESAKGNYVNAQYELGKLYAKGEEDHSSKLSKSLCVV